MKTPYGLEVIEDCVACPLLKDRLFCNLSSVSLQNLDAISSSATYPTGAVLFVEGQDPRGVFILCNGRVKLYGAASTGKSVIFRIAEAGEIVGLPSTLSDKVYEVTAEALEPVQANFIRRDLFLSFLRQNGDAALKVAEMLSAIYYSTCQEVRYLGLASTAVEKLARFLLDLKPSKGADPAKPKILLTLTHEEIAEMIGTSRETVSRLMNDLKRKKFIEPHGSGLTLTNKKGLQELVGAG
ncbi:MAG: Crp/Fnr family transcriptional regulator [Candidatus Acidiferrum sp.]